MLCSMSRTESALTRNNSDPVIHIQLGCKHMWLQDITRYGLPPWEASCHQVRVKIDNSSRTWISELHITASSSFHRHMYLYGVL